MTGSSTTQEASKKSKTSYYKKRFEGINTNKVLLDLWKDAYSKNVTGGSVTSAGKTDSETTSSEPVAEPKSENEAIAILRNAGDPSGMKKKKNKPVVMPIRVLQSIRLLLPPGSVDSALDQNKKEINLAFTPPYVPEMTEHRKKYLERMEKLRLSSEETKYSKITNNIKDQRQEDDKTARSMTYAASVGINMIVAPISFGTFMFFFSGGIFDYFFPIDDDDRRSRNPTGVDIKRLIVGVVSGVIMMIIEMVLFVIRSHEFESHTTKKKKKRGQQPFGSYSSNSAMTYTDGASSGNRSKTKKTPQSGEELMAKKTK